jgi:hypothetical protein
MSGTLRGRLGGAIIGFDVDYEISEVHPLIAALISCMEYHVYLDKHNSNGGSGGGSN